METAATGALHPDLSRIDGEIRQTLADFETLLSGLTEAQFNWRPAPGRWSIAQCLAHLNTVDGLDLEPVASAIRGARTRNLTGSGPHRYPWLNRYFIRQMEPPVKMKFKAPKAYIPPADAELASTLDTFRQARQTLFSLIQQANGLDLRRVKTPMPAMRFVKMPLGARFELLVAHDRRHLWQSRDVRNHPDFPA